MIRPFVTAFAVIFGIYLIGKSVFFVVDEREQVIITMFGKPVGEAYTEPGIKIKIPLLHDIRSFEKRIIEWDGHPNEVPTKDKRFIFIDTYARWRIEDPLLFLQRVTDEQGGQSRLDDIIDGKTRDAIARHDLEEVVRTTPHGNSAKSYTVTTANSALSNADLPNNYGRDSIARYILSQCQDPCSELGIELLDVRFKRLNYQKSSQESIYQRMISERKKAADKFRSEGQGEALRISGDREKDLRELMSYAERQADEIRGRADATASSIYAASYNRNSESKDFFKFLKTMETYEKTFSPKDTLLLSTKSDFYRYLNKP